MSLPLVDSRFLNTDNHEAETRRSNRVAQRKRRAAMNAEQVREDDERSGSRHKGKPCCGKVHCTCPCPRVHENRMKQLSGSAIEVEAIAIAIAIPIAIISRELPTVLFNGPWRDEGITIYYDDCHYVAIIDSPEGPEHYIDPKDLAFALKDLRGGFCPDWRFPCAQGDTRELIDPEEDSSDDDLWEQDPEMSNDFGEMELLPPTIRAGWRTQNSNGRLGDCAFGTIALACRVHGYCHPSMNSECVADFMREIACDVLTSRRASYERLWDRSAPTFSWEHIDVRTVSAIQGLCERCEQEDFLAYIALMRMPHIFGSAMEIHAIASHLNIQIVVVQPGKEDVFFNVRGYHAPNIAMLLHNSHYSLILDYNWEENIPAAMRHQPLERPKGGHGQNGRR